MSRAERQLTKLLRQILDILDEERKALVASDGEKVEKIVEIKNKYIEELSRYKGLDIKDDEKVMNIIRSIDAKQELNLLLTRQALSFQQVMLSSIAKNASSIANTYSSSGNFESEDKVNFVNQEV